MSIPQRQFRITSPGDQIQAHFLDGRFKARFPRGGLLIDPHIERHIKWKRTGDGGLIGKIRYIRNIKLNSYRFLIRFTPAPGGANEILIGARLTLLHKFLAVICYLIGLCMFGIGVLIPILALRILKAKVITMIDSVSSEMQKLDRELCDLMGSPHEAAGAADGVPFRSSEIAIPSEMPSAHPLQAVAPMHGRKGRKLVTVAAFTAIAILAAFMLSRPGESGDEPKSGPAQPLSSYSPVKPGAVSIQASDGEKAASDPQPDTTGGIASSGIPANVESKSDTKTVNLNSLPGRGIGVRETYHMNGLTRDRRVPLSFSADGTRLNGLTDRPDVGEVRELDLTNRRMVASASDASAHAASGTERKKGSAKWQLQLRPFESWRSIPGRPNLDGGLDLISEEENYRRVLPASVQLSQGELAVSPGGEWVVVVNGSDITCIRLKAKEPSPRRWSVQIPASGGFAAVRREDIASLCRSANAYAWLFPVTLPGSMTPDLKNPAGILQLKEMHDRSITAELTTEIGEVTKDCVVCFFSTNNGRIPPNPDVEPGAPKILSIAALGEVDEASPDRNAAAALPKHPAYVPAVPPVTSNPVPKDEQLSRIDRNGVTRLEVKMKGSFAAIWSDEGDLQGQIGVSGPIERSPDGESLAFTYSGRHIGTNVAVYTKRRDGGGGEACLTLPVLGAIELAKLLGWIPGEAMSPHLEVGLEGWTPDGNIVFNLLLPELNPTGEKPDIRAVMDKDGVLLCLADRSGRTINGEDELAGLFVQQVRAHEQCGRWERLRECLSDKLFYFGKVRPAEEVIDDKRETVSTAKLNVDEVVMPMHLSFLPNGSREIQFTSNFMFQDGKSSSSGRVAHRFVIAGNKDDGYRVVEEDAQILLKR